jgi:4-hydroxybenzoate polyprenyltransferase
VAAVTRPADLAELVRLPAALTVPGDTLAGAAAAGFPLGRRTAWLPVASVCLYWSGMALNDWADREVDAVERPERPIPSGRVSPAQALAAAAVLTAAGLGAAARGGGRDALRVAGPLAATVWAYDLVLKPTPFGPAAMALARALDVLLGAGGARAGRALPQAAAVGAHTLALTVLSRREVHGDPGGVASRVATAVSGGLVALIAARAPRPAPAGLAAAYAATVLPAQLRAGRDRDAASVRRAVGASILGTACLQAALLAGTGRTALAAGVAALLPLGRAAARRIAVT